jgi:eukaryotic-like serine/threonine-protein kinase
MSLEIGSRIGDYEIVSALGAGGMGKVFKVRNVISDRVEAMKVLLPDLEHEPELADRFMREIKVQASLQHPNIATLHTAVRVDNQLLMLMELVEGITLDQRLQQGPIPLRDGVDYIGQVLGALGYAHQRGVIHRDIKPANMMLTAKGTVKLMDFGIAKAAADRRLTMTGTTLGSLYYMSPEQIKGTATLDARSDLYSVGVSLYEIVTGKKPFDGDSQFAIMAAHLEKMPVPPVTLDAKLPQALNDVILMSIAKQPEQRFQSAEAFGAALGSVRQSLGLPAIGSATGSAATATMQQARLPDTVPLSQAPGEVQRKSSKRWIWVAAGALATAAALVAVIQFGPWRKTNAQVASQTAEAPRVTTPETSPSQPPPPMSTAPNPEPQVAAQPPATATELPAASVTTPKREAQKPAVRQIAKQLRNNEAPTTAAPAPLQPQAQQQAPPAQQQAPPASESAPRNPPARPPGPDPAVLQELRERLVKLDARAGAVRSSLQNLKNAQAAGGLSLRGDMTAAESRMNHMLDGANSALRAHDAAAAEKFMQSADTELEKLEKFLNL